MAFSFGKPAIIKYLAKHPDTETIVIAGAYGRKSAIRALGTILGSQFIVSFGVNKGIDADIIMLDYESSAEFPEFDAGVVVVTACQNEAEAQKYFAVANRARAVIINHCDVPDEYVQKYLTNKNCVTYGDELPSNYYFENTGSTIDGQTGNIVNLDGEHIPVNLKILGEHNVRPIVMACAVARLYGVEREKILEAAEAIRPLNGRMSPARGINGAIVIDDSADGTPVSVFYGLRAIYEIDAPSRIVVTDDASKLENINFDLVSEALILSNQKPQQIPGHFKYFTDELELVNYLGTRAEENGIILLEFPLPEIISNYLWQ